MRASAVQERHRTARQGEVAREQGQQFVVGLACRRRRGEPHAQPAAVQAIDAGRARAWLDVEVQYQGLAPPGKPGRAVQSSVIAKSRKGATTNICASCRPISATIGVRSSPPSGGSTARSGLSSGCVIESISDRTGL